MSVPKSKVISVTKGFMALADLKNQSPSNTNSQSVIVNVSPPEKTREIGKPYVDEDGIVIVPTKSETPSTFNHPQSQEENETKVQYGPKDLRDGVPYNPPPENPYSTTRELSNFNDIKNDYEELKALLKQQEALSRALSIMLNLVEHNPLIINKVIVAPRNVLAELIKLLTSADEVSFKESDPEIRCSLSSVKYNVIEKIYVLKNNETFNLKYSFPDVIKILDEHRISLKLVAN